MSALETRPAAKTIPTSAAEPPLRTRKMGSSGRKNHIPTAFRKLIAYSVHSVRLCSIAIRNTGRAVMADRLREAGWDVIPTSPQTAHMHMALDEILLGQ